VLLGQIAKVEEEIALLEGDLQDAIDDSREAEADLVRISLTLIREEIAAALKANNDAEAKVIKLRDELEVKRVDLMGLEASLRDLNFCAREGQSTFAATPYAPFASSFAPTSPMSAFANFGPGTAGLGGTAILAEHDGARVWASAAGSLFGGGGTADIAGAKGSVSIGAGRRLNETTAIGGQVSVLGGRTEIGAANAAINALIASSHRLAESVRLDLGLAGGYAWNSIDIGGITGQFGSGEIAAFASLGGEHEANGFVLAPSASVVVSHLATSAYTLSDNTAVGATGTSRLDLSGGLRISRPMVLPERDMLLRPFVEVTAGYGLSSPASITVAPGTSLALGGPIATFAAGIEGERFNGINFNLRGGVTGRSSGLWSVGVSGGISGSL
jgi:hypothetical protein